MEAATPAAYDNQSVRCHDYSEDEDYGEEKMNGKLPKMDNAQLEATLNSSPLQDNGIVSINNREATVADLQASDTHSVSNGESFIFQKLQQLENDLSTSKLDLRSVKKTLVATEMVNNNLLQQLERTETKLRQEMRVMQQEFDVYKQEFKKREELLIQKLDNAKNETSSTKQQLASVDQSLAKVEQKYSTLAANTDEALIQLETRFLKMAANTEKISGSKITDLADKLQERTQQVEMVLYWAIHINTEAIKSSLHSQVVPVILKMSDYSSKIKHRADWYSDPFYTHQKGYKMCLNVFAAGLNSPHLTVWLHLIKGSYDNRLKWPLKGRCEIKLLNQVSNCKHHCEVGVIESGDKQPSVHKKHYIWYNYEFISHEDLETSNSSCQYLKDDALFFQVQCKLD